MAIPFMNSNKAPQTQLFAMLHLKSQTYEENNYSLFSSNELADLSYLKLWVDGKTGNTYTLEKI
jgi:hypothetical protein